MKDFTKRWREKTECSEGYKTTDCKNGPKATPTPGGDRDRASPYAITYARMPPREWNAASYDRMSDPQVAMARDVIDRLDLRGDERVLDAGCGTGRVTELLLERVPNGSVVAVDGSEAMVEQARERLGDRAEVFASDLLELTLEHPGRRGPLDRHVPLDRRPRAAVRAPARGAEARRPARRAVRRLRQRRQRAGRDRRRRPPGAARVARARGTSRRRRTRGARLEAAGFTDVWTWLQPWPVQPDDPREYFTTTIVGSHLDRLPEAERAPFVDAVLARLDEPVVANYVRLNLLARR